MAWRLFKKENLPLPEFKSRPFVVLHLSDIHFLNHGYDCSRRKVARAFHRALRRHQTAWQNALPGRPAFSALFIAGDVTYQNRYEDLAWAQEFISHVLAGSGIKGKMVFVVPGEHDVYLKFIQNTDDEFQFDSADEWNQLLEQERKGRSQRIAGRFSGYLEFLHSLGVSLGTMVPSATADIFWSEIINHEGLSVAVLGLNSAWSCRCRLDEDREKLCIGSFQISESYQSVRRLNHDRDPDLVIGLFHHPLAWLKKGDQACVYLLGRYCNVIFRGNMHMGEDVLTSEGKVIPVLSASNLYKADLVPGFQVAAMDPAAKKVHVWPYLWDRKSLAFLPPTELPEPFKSERFLSYDLG